LKDESYIIQQEPAKDTRRWCAMFLIFLYQISQLYNYDTPSLIQTKLMNEFKVSNSKYSLMYTMYSLPNLVFPLFGGCLMDKFGSDVMLIVSSILAAIGPVITWYGACDQSFYTMVFGRFIFGPGSEMLLVMQYVNLSKWFSDSEYSKAVGFCQAFGTIISLSNGFITPQIAQAYGTHTALFVGAVVGAVSIVFMLMYLSLSRKVEQEKLALETESIF
jgi:MFS family permease